MPLDAYESLPINDSDVFDVLIRCATLVIPGLEPYRADLGINFRTPLDLEDGTIAEIGELPEFAGRVVVDAAGLFVHPRRTALVRRNGAPHVLRPGRTASFVVREGVSPCSRAVYRVDVGVVERLEGDPGIRRPIPVDLR